MFFPPVFHHLICSYGDRRPTEIHYLEYNYRFIWLWAQLETFWIMQVVNGTNYETNILHIKSLNQKILLLPLLPSMQ